MNKDFSKIVMNPVRQRIIQYLLLNKTATVNQIAQELSDIPKPSIYRHMKVLTDANCIEVTQEKAVRGTIEKTYSMVARPMGAEPTIDEINMLIQNTIFKISASFSKYFKGEDPQPQKDLLSVSTSTLMLSDEEFMEFMGKIGQVYNEVIQNKASEGRKPRCLTFISSPADNY